ncbi:hypothetical protein ABB37_01217 [Leptomonas pyrrhocoris]|uniref:Serine/threonine-protein phosphatase 2A 55 kDa regulatory subunit B n=1 Tax=Leptomonas pyrrhocoris TaxID=157538 RepID=A0A0N0DYZ9_LEPPY|nr:hypothetical protein ABB37_01217 [Leptomonas pyrrhocoris]KPA84715.1 hypothetical protein ABB37_01217 [Leptomonas pyrrhocoris]|eukprot:XP_015663154.1 hypothetical protein ABB37_01217 [Leptomonas pyrrhocoris]
MEPRKPVEKDHPKLSPSPEMPSVEQAQLQSLRSSRATSEARSEPGPMSPSGNNNNLGSPTFSDVQRASYRSSRAGSEAPQREPMAASPTGGSRREAYASYRSSRAGSEAPDRLAASGYDMGDERSARSSRAGSEAPDRGGVGGGGGGGGKEGPTIPSPKRTPQKTKPSTMFISASSGNRAARGGAGLSGGLFGESYGGGVRAPQSVREHIQNVEQRLYGTVSRATTTFQFYQKLHYPLEDPNAVEEVDVEDNATERGEKAMSESMPSAMSLQGKEPSPQPRLGSHLNAGNETGTPSPAIRIEGEGGSSDGLGGGVTSSSPASFVGSRSPPGIVPPAMVPNSSNSLTGSSSSPSPTFDEAAFNAAYDDSNFLNSSGEMLGESSRATTHGAGGNEESALQSVSVVAMTSLMDPMSGAPVLGVCLGDYSGHIEYFEVSTADSYNAPIRRSKSVMQMRPTYGASEGSALPGVQLFNTRGSWRRSSDDGTATTASPHPGGDSNSMDSAATENIMRDMRGREVLRRHSHKAFVKSINALTSVAVEPYVKCLTFVRPRCSPSMISYLTANERVIKLFHVRREGFSPFNAFPGMEEVIGKTFAGSRYFARLPPQPAILPIKEFGPVTNSIQALSVSADGETFMSVEDLQVFWWHFETEDTTKATCIADLRPPSGALDEVEELVTASSFHPTHSSLFLLTRSSGVLNIGDLRDPPSRQKRKYAIRSELTPQQNPLSCPAYDEILCSISDASFLGPDHVVTRDYLSLKLWDLRKPDQPCAMMPVMNYVSKYLDSLYENDSIFDRFPVAVDDVSGTVVTGLYDGAVAVWQPLYTSLPLSDSLVHYRADPFAEPGDVAAGGVVTVPELEKTLAEAWAQTLAAPHQTHMPQSTNEDEDGAMGIAEEAIPEPFTNKVLTIAIAPGGERFGYTYKNGRLVYVFERRSEF